MQPPSQLTKLASRMLMASLERFGNTLNTPHRMALHCLLDAMSSMAEGKLQGRWAFGLPTGTGKTRAIIEWATAVHTLGLPYTLAVSASRIGALSTLKRDMIENGIPEWKIGLLHDATAKQIKDDDLEPATDDNDDRPFMLVTHQRIRSKKNNLDQYNLYKGQPRNLLLYDESLMISDVEHFNYSDLTGDIAHKIYKCKHDLRHVDIYNYLVECLKLLEYVFEHYEEAQHDLHLIESPAIDPKLAERYARDWEKEGIISQFLRAANLDLRMVKAGQAAVVSYRIVIPEALKNIIVLDASYPIRKLCHFDQTIMNAETLPSVKQIGVTSFHDLKRFDRVTLKRLRAYGGRNTMEKRFKDKTMAKEVVTVLKTIPETESVLFFVYRLNKPGGCDYSKILASEIERSGIDLHAMTPDGKPRLTITSWGNETSLNCYSHCRHVFLVGILHRDATELMGQYLGQTDDIKGEVSKTLTDDIQLSEKAHLGYQALSRGNCRNVSNGQAGDMTGYLVEISPEIETTLSKVMPGAKWETWKPFFVKESNGLIEEWAGKVQAYLETVPETVQKVSSRSVKKALQADKIAPRTWAVIIKSISDQTCIASKDRMEHCTFRPWVLQGSSLVRLTGQHFGFIDESQQVA